MPQIQLYAPSAGGRTALEIQNIDVRAATVADLRSISRLFDDYRVFYGRSSNRRAARAFVAQRLARGESVILLARSRSARAHAWADVGFAQLYRSFSSVLLGPALLLNDLYVAPAARRMGIGGLLVDACTALARRERVVSLQLETHPDNAPAMRLYARKGFVADTEYSRLSFPLGSGATARTVGT